MPQAFEINKGEKEWKEINPQEKAMAEQVMPGIEGQKFKVNFDNAIKEKFEDVFHGLPHPAEDLNHPIWNEKKPIGEFDDLRDGHFLGAVPKRNIIADEAGMFPQVKQDDFEGAWIMKEVPNKIPLVDMNAIVNDRIWLGNDNIIVDPLPREHKRLGIMVDYDNKELIMRDLRLDNVIKVSLEVQTIANAIATCLENLFPNEFEIVVD